MTAGAPQVVVDTNGAEYALDRLLGEGAQGSVFAVRGRDLAIKLSSVRHQLAQEQVRQNIARVRRLPLDGLKVARPLRALRNPNVGYVMELMTGMVPLVELAHVPTGEAHNLAEWYRATGGLYRRLRIMASTAALFRSLHERGLTYGDASPHNIFISQDISASEAWLIDCDNIVQGVSSRAVYTPGYAAPELFRHHPGADSLTDSWSLATLAFETICGIHPFDGDLVHEGSPEVEEQALRGELPWIDDEGDVSNSSSRGLPRAMVLTPPLVRLASNCFGFSRSQRERRPTAAAWADALANGADQTVICPACQMSYYFTLSSCPWCEAPRPAFGIANVFLRDPALDDDARTPLRVVCRAPGRPALVQRVIVQAGHETALTNRHLTGLHDETPQLTVRLEETRLLIRGPEGCAHALEHRREGKQIPMAGRTERLDLRQGKTWWWLVPLKAQGIHRVATFELHGTARS